MTRRVKSTATLATIGRDRKVLEKARSLICNEGDHGRRSLRKVMRGHARSPVNRHRVVTVALLRAAL